MNKRYKTILILTLCHFICQFVLSFCVSIAYGFFPMALKPIVTFSNIFNFPTPILFRYFTFSSPISYVTINFLNSMLWGITIFGCYKLYINFLKTKQ